MKQLLIWVLIIALAAAMVSVMSATREEMNKPKWNNPSVSVSYP